MSTRRLIAIRILQGLVLLVYGNAAYCQSSYKLVDLGTGEALSVNAGGSVVGFQWNSATGHWFPFIWDSTHGLRLIAGTDVTPLKINNNNEAVGYVSNSRAAYITETGGTVDLNTVLSPTDQAVWFLSNASDINDSGVVIGTGLYKGVDASFILNLRTSPPTISLFPVEPGWSFSQPEAINSSGIIVGESNVNTTRQGFAYNGAFADLPLQYAQALNNAGDAAGRVNNQAAFLPSGARSATLIGNLGGSTSVSRAVNLPTNGKPTTVVGDAPSGKGASAIQHGFRWQVGGKITDLTSLVSNLPRRWYVSTAQAVNGAGLIAGQAGDGTNNHAVVLMP
jgi:hypothetical protein